MIWPLPQADDADLLRRVHTLTHDVLAQLAGLAGPTRHRRTHLVVVTRHAVSVGAYDDVPDLAHAAAWALIHTAQNEHPDRITLLDTDDTVATDGQAVGHRSRRDRPASRSWPCATVLSTFPAWPAPRSSTPPDASDWQLGTTYKGDLTNLTLLPTDPPNTLAPGQIRVQVRAAG